MTIQINAIHCLGIAVLFSLVCLTSSEVILDKEGPGDDKGTFKCYVCNSFYSPTCADFFNNRTWEITPCKPDEKMCRKIVQEAWYDNSWNVRYIRQCAKLGTVGYDEGRRCKERVGTYRIKMRYCYCDNKDGCNSGHKMLISPVIALPFILGLLRLR